MKEGLKRDGTVEENSGVICGPMVENKNKKLMKEKIQNTQKNILKQYRKTKDGDNLITMLVKDGIEIDAKNHPKYNPEDERYVEHHKNLFKLSDFKNEKQRKIESLTKFAEFKAIELFNEFFKDLYTIIKTNEYDDFKNNRDLLFCSLNAKFPTLGMDVTITDCKAVFQEKDNRFIEINSSKSNIRYGIVYKNNRYSKEEILNAPLFNLRIRRELLEKYFDTTDNDDREDIKKEIFSDFCQEMINQYEELKNEKNRLGEKYQELDKLTKNEYVSKGLTVCKERLSYLKKILKKIKPFIDYVKDKK